MSVLPDQFTHDAYGGFLDAALRSQYTFRGFDCIRGTSEIPADPFILLRHDIDYDPRFAVAIGALEAARGIGATYLFQVDSPFYTLEEATPIIERLLTAGHHLGLHFDANGSDDDAEVVRAVDQHVRMLAERFSTPIDVVSFHMPGRRPVEHLRLIGGEMNTYSPFFTQAIDYISDSNQSWRGRDLLHVVTVERPRALQVLTHPIWWQPVFTPFIQSLSALAERLGLDVEREILTDEQRALLASEVG